MIPRSLLAALAFSAGLAVGLLIAPAVTAAPRPALSAPDVLARAGVARDSERTGAPTLTPAQRPGNTGGAPSHDPIGGATPGVTGANDTAAGPSPAAVPLRSPGHIHGQASWVRASLGSHYLAARMPRGTGLRITGPLGSVVRVVTDYGPSRTVFPDRIVDLSARDYQRVCGPLSTGTCPVTVTR